MTAIMKEDFLDSSKNLKVFISSYYAPGTNSKSHSMDVIADQTRFMYTTDYGYMQRKQRLAVLEEVMIVVDGKACPNEKHFLLMEYKLNEGGWLLCAWHGNR